MVHNASNRKDRCADTTKTKQNKWIKAMFCLVKNAKREQVRPDFSFTCKATEVAKPDSLTLRILHNAKHAEAKYRFEHCQKL